MILFKQKQGGRFGEFVWDLFFFSIWEVFLRNVNDVSGFVSSEGAKGGS